jgi:hypothetical protein
MQRWKAPEIASENEGGLGVMSDKIEKGDLAQRWVHSHEEDSDTEMVYRPASYKFPPSRGRSSFELKPDGSLRESGPGPSDRSEQSKGTWRLDAGKNLVLDPGPGERQRSRILKLVSAGRDRLVVKK